MNPPKPLESIDDKKTSLRDEMKEIKEMLQGKSMKKKKKEFKLPFKVRSKVRKAAEKNAVMVVYLRRNRAINVTVGQMQDGFVWVGNQFHNASTDFFFVYKKLPCLVIPEWNLNPIGTEDYYDAVKNKQTTDGQTTIIKALEAAEKLGKPKISGKGWIWIIIAGAAVAYFIFGR